MTSGIALVIASTSLFDTSRVAVGQMAEPHRALIGWIIFFVLGILILGQIGEWLGRLGTPPRPPSFHPPPITTPPSDETAVLAIPIADEQREECIARANQLAASGKPGWPYRVALTFLAPQLAELRERFDRLLVAPPRFLPHRLSGHQHLDYLRERDRELREELVKLSLQFSQELARICGRQELHAIGPATKEIVQHCHWLYLWAVDHYRYRDASGGLEPHSSYPRTAEHVFRQVEALVGDLRRTVAAPDFTGPLLFRAEFCYPKSEEVDKPVLAVLSPPKSQPGVED